MTKSISIPELLHEYETRLLKDKLLEFPGKIRRIKGELATERRLLTDAQNNKTEAEAMLVSMIAAETNSNTGKAMFTNAEMRAAELTKRKASDAEYQQAEKDCNNAEVGVNSLQFDLERLQDEFRAYRYIVDLTARELAVWAGNELNGGNGNGENGGSNKQPY